MNESNQTNSTHHQWTINIYTQRDLSLKGNGWMCLVAFQGQWLWFEFRQCKWRETECHSLMNSVWVLPHSLVQSQRGCVSSGGLRLIIQCQTRIHDPTIAADPDQFGERERVWLGCCCLVARENTITDPKHPPRASIYFGGVSSPQVGDWSWGGQVSRIFCSLAVKYQGVSLREKRDWDVAWLKSRRVHRLFGW